MAARAGKGKGRASRAAPPAGKPAARRAAPGAQVTRTKGARRPKPKPARKGAAPFNTTSTFSPRLRGIHAALDREVRRRFPGAENVMAYNMNGWRVPRPLRVEWTRGTIDPNFLHMFLAERKQGITLHLWSPFDPGGLRRSERELAAAGFQVMVGCLQFNRKGDYPVAAVAAILDGVRRDMDAERAAGPRGSA